MEQGVEVLASRRPFSAMLRERVSAGHSTRRSRSHYDPGVRTALIDRP
jgi:hypothetical protein